MMINTIGYEGASLADFLQTLKSVNVSILIDVRDRAQSRRKGFSKTALSEALATININYIHMPNLGDPKEGREAARSGNIPKFRRIFGNVLKTSDAKKALVEIKTLADNVDVCLLCYERDPNTCHRKMITDKLVAEMDANVRHLGVRKFEQAA